MKNTFFFADKRKFWKQKKESNKIGGLKMMKKNRQVKGGGLSKLICWL